MLSSPELGQWGLPRCQAHVAHLRNWRKRVWPFKGTRDPGQGFPWFCPRYLGSGEQASLEGLKGEGSLAPSVPCPQPGLRMHQNLSSSVSQQGRCSDPPPTTTTRVTNLSGQAGAQFPWSASARVKTNICAGALAPKELTGGYSRPGGHVQAWC